jgi:late competence protein required for DNA uptake (superfamily II DNA/RNA helicase)
MKTAIPFMIKEALKTKKLPTKPLKCESCGNLRAKERRKGNYSTFYCEDCYVNLKYASDGAI